MRFSSCLRAVRVTAGMRFASLTLVATVSLTPPILCEVSQAAPGPTPLLVSRSNGQWEAELSVPAASAKVDGQRTVEVNSGRLALSKLAAGLHTIEVDSKPVLTLLLRESGSASPTPPTRAFDAVIEDPKLRRPAPTFRVTQGELIQIDVRSATGADVHLHGYDIAGHVGSDSPLIVAFDANLAGRFSFETHGPTHSTFAFVEVLPR